MFMRVSLVRRHSGERRNPEFFPESSDCNLELLRPRECPKLFAFDELTNP